MNSIGRASLFHRIVSNFCKSDRLLAIKIFSGINLEHPFRLQVANLLTKISYFSLGTGILALVGNAYSNWLMEKNVTYQFDWGGAEFLFMAGIILVIALLFKRGIEIQSENELTI